MSDSTGSQGLAETEAKPSAALQALDDALCNYTNWVDDFSELTDPDHRRVFDVLCAAYNAWHDSRRTLKAEGLAPVSATEGSHS